MSARQWCPICQQWVDHTLADHQAAAGHSGLESSVRVLEGQAALSSSALLAAFLEEEAWIEAECAAMERKPEIYHADDHIGLPYMRTIIRSIRHAAEKVPSNDSE